jgi:membrane protease YdiL (CAAX protease family)
MALPPAATSLLPAVTTAAPRHAPAPPKPTLPPVEHIEPLPLPLETFTDVNWFHSIIGSPMVKWLLPVPILLALAPIAWWMFRKTWVELDQEATAFRVKLTARGGMDYRPHVCLAIVSIVLTIHEYYGGRSFYDSELRPVLERLASSGHRYIQLSKYDSLYGYAWWVSARVLGYIVVPVVVWKVCFPRDALLDYGLRVKGFFQHLWIYGVFLAIVVPVMLLVAQQPYFGSYYPFYKLSSRSWADFLMWEAMYCLQFFALEFFFRGWMVGALRHSLGSSAILVMCVPYAMIHYGKPYLEAHGALVAGVVLGSLSMRTKSVYSGFLLHVTVAFGMDLLSLFKRGHLPTTFWAPG